MRCQALCPFIAGALLSTGAAFAQNYTFATIDVSCAASTAASACPPGLAPGQVATQTSARGINARGEIVGLYIAGGKQRGFLLSGGSYTGFEFPIAGVRVTVANGINTRGEIVGQYTLPVHDLANPPAEDSPLYCPGPADPACNKGFHYWNGQFSTVTFPGHPGAVAQRITPDGDIYGCLHDHDLGMSMFGATWTRAGAVSLDANGGQLADGMAVPMSMNNGGTPGGGTIVGFFVDMSSGQTRGYLVRNGMFEPYDPTPTTALTALWDINPSGQFIGTYREAAEVATKRHGLLQTPGAAPVTLDFICQQPAGCTGGASLGQVAFSTVAFGINPDGVIVGQYAIASGGALHGFIAIPPD